MVYRHGSILGLAELSLIVGRKGLASLSTDVRRIPVCSRSFAFAISVSDQRLRVF